MGCCVSKGVQELYIDIPRSVSTNDEWVLRQKSFLDGCKLLPYTAACPASYPYQCLTRVVLGDGHLFAALWEGKGGSQAARHCVSACYDELMGFLAAGHEPSAALQKAFKAMDESYLASDLPDLVKASVGAAGTMLLLDIKTNRCHVARLGRAMPFATATKGSFNTVAVEVKDLVPFSNNVRARSSGGASSSAAAQQQAQQQQQQQQQHDQQWDPATAGVTHAIGLGCSKRDDLRKVWQRHQQQQQQQGGKQQRVPRISNDCEVYVSQLSTQDENLVIAAEGLVQVSPPNEIATLLQHFNAGALADTKRALCGIKEQQLELRRQQEEESGAAAGSRASSGGRAAKRKAPDAPEVPHNPLAELQTPTNVASIVVHQALAKSLDRFNTAMNARPAYLQQQQQQQQQQQAAAPGGRQQPGAAYQVQPGPSELTYDELTHLPLNVDIGAFATTAKGEQRQVRLPDDYPVGGLSKADVHGDLGVIVIALNWPRPPDAIRTGGAQVTPLRPGPRALTRRPEAEWRWMLLRLHVKARQAYKRGLRKAWWQLVDDVQAAAEAAARQAEVHAWKTKGAAVKVNLVGAVVGPEAPISYMRAHQTPPGPARQPYRQTTPSSGGRGGSTPGSTTLTGWHAGSSSSAGGAGGHGRSGGGGYSSGMPAAGQDLSAGLSDVGVRSLRSGGGVRGGVVAAAVAAINAKGSPQKESAAAADSPCSAAGSYRSSRSPSSSVKAPAAGALQGGVARCGGDMFLTPEQSSYGGLDTAYDCLDSPSKALDSPSSAKFGAWGSTPQGSMARGGSGGGAAGWSGGSTPSRIPTSSGGGAGAHKGLSLRSSRGGAGAHKGSVSPAAVSTPASGRQQQGGTPPGGYVASAGVTGRRGTSGGGSAGGVGSARGASGGTPGRAEIGLRSARKPAAVRR